MRYLIDTNVVSELRKKRPDPAVIEWVNGLGPDEVHLSVLTVGELRAGAARLAARGDEIAAQALTVWIEGLVEQYDDQVLPVTAAVADRWGELNSVRPLPAVDSLLAATALEHGLTVSTRNAKDFASTGVDVYNPFSVEA
ncbi:type II toxin-antitoxin system VapC family toxin [Nocardioides sp. NPDC057772]|uniref:type II toxin-antitoxin system VapC family toxin n=1 Tax=Nocardioides sp. NPDC057772 TaxID=3346245 RepID=UPI00366BAC74